MNFQVLLMKQGGSGPYANKTYIQSHDPQDYIVKATKFYSQFKFMSFCVYHLIVTLFKLSLNLGTVCHEKYFYGFKFVLPSLINQGYYGSHPVIRFSLRLSV